MADMAVRSHDAGDRPFVGRTREFELGLRVIADNDRTGVILVGGDAGLGKTRLTQEIVQAIDARVLWAAAVPRPTPVPWELVHFARRSIATAETTLFDIESIAALNRPDRIRAEAESLRTDDGEPTIYVFEDIHWADPDSLDVIDRLIAAGPLNATVILTYRTSALRPSHASSAFLQRVERRPYVAQFRLEPLRREEVGAYLAAEGRSMDGSVVDHVHGRTGGSPLLLCELVGATPDDADLTSGLPWTLGEMLRPEIERLDPAERSVAQAVAVLGTEVEFELLAAATQLAERELLTHLRSLADRGVLVEVGPDRFGFRHDLVREAVAEGLFTREHRRIHAAAHDELVASGSTDAVALVAHATGAGRAQAAADAARIAAHESLACGHSHQAFAFAEQALLEHETDIDLLRTAVLAGWMTDQHDQALDHLACWERLVKGDLEAQAEVLHHRVRLLWEEDDYAGADRAFGELERLTEQLPKGAVQVQALADMAQHQMLCGREDETLELVDAALAAAEGLGPEADAAVRQARVERATILAHGPLDGRTPAIEHLLQIADEADALGDHVIAARALHNIPHEHPSVDACKLIERMRAHSERAGLRTMATDAYRTMMLNIALLEDDLATFDALAEAAVADLGHLPRMETLIAEVALDTRRYSAAEAIASRIGTPDELNATVSTGLHALVALLVDEDPTLARAWLEDEPGNPKIDGFILGSTLPHLSDLLDAGLDDALAALLARDRSSEFHEPAHEAMRAELDGRLADADALYATALAEGMRRTVYEAAEIHLARARIATARGDDPRPHIEAAADRLCGWPGRRMDRVEAMLDAPVRRLAPSDLTRREREVATLVARGLTNGGIADQLFISTKTASVHVSNILAKLHMSSRTEIAAWVNDGGLDT